MKEKHSGTDAKKQPSCQMSAQYAKWLDEIDLHLADHRVMTSDDLSTILSDDIQADEDDYGATLVNHARHCMICRETLVRARNERNWQRTALRDMLEEGESLVPSTRSSILAAIQKDAARSGVRSTQKRHDPVTPLPLPIPIPLKSERPLASSRRKAALTWVAAVVVVVVALSVFSQFILQRSNGALLTITGHTPTARTGPVATPLKTDVPALAENWSSVLLTYTSKSDKRTGIEHLNPRTGQAAPAFQQGCCPDEVSVESISHRGDDFVFRQYDGQTTTYSLFSSGMIFKSDGVGGNAIWSTGDDYLFINSTEGIIRVETATGRSQLINSESTYSKLEFYYNGELYVSRENTQPEEDEKDLYRLNIETGQEQKLISKALSDYSFWLDLKTQGDRLYYVKGDPTGRVGIYQVNSDGANEQLVRQNAIPIGYNAEPDFSLLMMKQDVNRFQVATVSEAESTDQVLVDDIAPGASALCSQPVQQKSLAICEKDIAMIPEGGSYLVFGAQYPETDEYKFWSINLQVPEQRPVSLWSFTSRSEQQARLVGWDKFQV